MSDETTDPSAGDIEREWSEKEQGAIQTLVDLAWDDTEFEISDYEGAATQFVNWEEIVTEADRRWYEQFESVADEMDNRTVDADTDRREESD